MKINNKYINGKLQRLKYEFRDLEKAYFYWTKRDDERFEEIEKRLKKMEEELR
jgi:hypothetical protein